jgi:hypothetical protein
MKEDSKILTGDTSIMDYDAKTWYKMSPNGIDGRAASIDATSAIIGATKTSTDHPRPSSI